MAINLPADLHYIYMHIHIYINTYIHLSILTRHYQACHEPHIYIYIYICMEGPEGRGYNAILEYIYTHLSILTWHYQACHEHQLHLPHGKIQQKQNLCNGVKG
jgi:hypothetical protein